MTTIRMPLMEIENDVPSTPAAGSRRKSGRAVKVPEKFVPDFPSSTNPTKAKRKRTDDDGGDDASENEEIDPEDEDEDEVEDEESAGEEELREARRRARSSKRPAAKKPKTNGITSHAKAPAVRLPARPKKAKRVVLADENAEGLYADVFTGDQQPDDVVAGFLNRYGENGPGAVAELVNFVLKSAGCDLQVTEDDINDADNINGKITDLQEEYQAQNISDYPLISRAKNSHVFRASFLDFFDSLNKTLDTTGALYDEEDLLMENIFHWMASMSSSTLRPFRHTATAVALTLGTSTCKLAKDQIEIAAKTLRQLEGEKKNRKPNKARLADFEKKVQYGEGKKEILEDRLKDIFDTIWVHRYRDVDPKIRAECMEALGQWIHILPSYWFEGSYLRYFGWMLTDTAPSMRHEVVKQIEKIMKNPDNVGRMGSFIERFRPRIIEIATRDSDPGVRSSAVDLVDLLRASGLLEPDDVDVIGKLIFDSEPKVRKAVVGFFVDVINDAFEEQVEELGGEDTLEEILHLEPDSYDSPRASWIKLKCLASTLQVYDSSDQEEMSSQIDKTNVERFLNLGAGGESRFTLAAQALYEKMPELKEWEVLAGYLLYDHSANPKKTSQGNRALKEAFRPDETEEIVLLEILNAIVKLSLTQIAEGDKGKDRGKKKHARHDSPDKETTARHLAEIIPRLLKKFGADPKTATAVLRLEHSLNLSVFQVLRQDSSYAKLLDEISAQFSAHADKGVLSEASAALLHARKYEELEEITEVKLQTLWEDTTTILQNINKAGEVSVRGAFTESILTELSNNLAKVEKLSSISNNVEVLEADAGNENPAPITILLNVVARGELREADPDIDALEDEVVLAATRSAMFYFMWKVHSLAGSLSSGEEVPDVEIDQLKTWQEEFIANLVAAISSRATLDPVRLLATGTLLDLHVLFATLKTNEGEGNQHEHIQTLFKHIAPEVQTELTAIFDHAEKHYAKKAKKKLEEPDEDEEPEDDLESEDEDEDMTENERQSEILKAEQQLCELTGKLILAILAKVIDAQGPLEGKLRRRIERNRIRLGPNFKEVVAFLDQPKPKPKRSGKSRAMSVAEKNKEAIRKELEKEDEESEEDDDDPFADVEPEEGTAEDLRRRELVEDEDADEDEEEANAEDNGDAEVEAEAEAEAEGGEGEGAADAEDDEDEDEDMLGD